MVHVYFKIATNVLQPFNFTNQSLPFFLLIKLLRGFLLIMIPKGTSCIRPFSTVISCLTINGITQNFSLRQGKTVLNAYLV